MTGNHGDARYPDPAPFGSLAPGSGWRRLTPVERAERQLRIVALRAAGETWEAVGAAVGLSERQARREASAYAAGVQRLRARDRDLIGAA